MCIVLDEKEALKYDNLRINMLSVSPDDHPVVGNLKHHPNVFVNIGYGQR